MFRKATRTVQRARIALAGPTGSGKTFSALRLAAGLGAKRIAVIDTEHGSSELYADREGLPAFDVCDLRPPYDPRRYVEALHAAANAGYDVVIVDSLSHAWNGAGGVLELVDRAGKRGNNFAAWGNVTPHHNALVEALLSYPGHLIATMRSKMAYEVVENARGKKAPRKLGMAPIQRAGMEYEFTLVWDLAVDHSACSTKDRTSLFDGRILQQLTEAEGQAIAVWLNTGKVSEPFETPKNNRPIELAPPPTQQQPPAPAETRPPAPTANSRVDAAIEYLRRVKADLANYGLMPQDVARKLNKLAGAEIITTKGLAKSKLTEEVLSRIEADARRRSAA